jgi:hypothetical protein
MGYSMNILDLPLDRQRLIAKRMGFDDLEAWRAHMRELLGRCAKESAQVDAESDLLDKMSPEDREHARKKFGEPGGFRAVLEEDI